MKIQLITLAFITCLNGLNAEKGYLFTAPKVLDAGSSERLCLTLKDVTGPGTVTVQLLQEKVDILIVETVVKFPRQDSCFFLEVPNVKYTTGRIVIKGEFKSDEYTFESETKVALASRSTLTFVQTDKAIYKPGQKVQFRILTVNHFLEPTPVTISKVFIQNPNGVRVAQWLNVSNENGLVQLDMQLSDEPTYGNWKINTQVNGVKKVQQFEVNEYVLPKFEVKITPPTYLLANSETATWKICAHYTYGKGVQGTLKLKMKYQRYYWERSDQLPENNVETKINGCHDITVYASTMKWNTRATQYKDIEVTAEVEEDGTGIKFSDSKKTDIEQTPLKLEFKSKVSQRYLKPGLPYSDQLAVTRPDSQPVAGELIKICYTSHSVDTSKKSCKNYTSDENGLINFTVPPQKENYNRVSVDSIALHYPNQYYDNNKYRFKVRQPVASMSLTVWYSPSGSFLNIKPTINTISCEESIPLEVYYTTDGVDVAVHYQVMSRGRIVAHGMKEYTFSAKDYKEDETYIQDEDKTSNRTKRYSYVEPVNYTLPSDIGKFNVMLDVNSKMSPVARVLMYYIRPDGETVAAHAILDVKPCFQNKVSFKFDENSIKPGTAAKYKISAAPKSICAVGVVDKSVHLLRSDNQLTADKVFSVLKTFDANKHTNPVLVNDAVYCKEKLKGRITTSAPTTSTAITRPPPIKIETPVDDSVLIKKTTLRPPPPPTRKETPVDDSVLIKKTTLRPPPPLTRRETPVDDSVLIKKATLRPPPPTRMETPVDDSVLIKKATLRPPPPTKMETPVDDSALIKKPVQRKKRSSPPWIQESYSSEYADSLMAFEITGQVVSSSYDLESRPCNYDTWRRYFAQEFAFGGGGPDLVRRQPSPIANSARPENEESGVNEAVEVRNYFPETWLWDIEVVGDNGYLDKEADIPHTITEWVGGAFCTSPSKGLGIAPSSSIKAFQPFFVSYALPYSVVRKEKVPLVVTVFNYLSDCLAIKLTLEKSDDYVLLSENSMHTMCVCGGQPATHRFRILPTSLGQVNFTVYSYSLKDENHEVCSADKKASSLEARDAITKPLLVEPEGFPQESTESLLFCPSEHPDGFKHNFELMLPDDLVEDSARAYFSVSGDIMGPSLSGLDKLVRRPTGCGEQNMIGFVPNIFVMQYLESTGSLSSDIEKKALGFMKIGYQRELNYRHTDGSYSAFGSSDPEGSSWLTAFVIKSFAQAQQYIDIDPEDLKKSTDWLLSKQQPDGCFPFIGMIHHQDMKGGVGSGKPTALTAYMIISLLESKTPVEKAKLDAAFACIAKETEPNYYAQALTAYAASLDGRLTLANDLLKKLFSGATIDGTNTYWAAASKSVSVELGAYVILTLMNLGGTENQAKALNIVRWIASQRNANGGFVSTQDTVIALQAFAKYAVVQSKKKQDLEINVEGNGFSNKYEVNRHNRLLMQTDKITELPNIIDVTAVGDGCGLVQTTLKYNRQNVNASEALSLTVAGSNIEWNCKRRKIDICTSYKIPGEKSNMAVLSVKMVSGFIPVKSDLKYLKQRSELNLKRYEVDANYVNFYFDYLSNKETCFSLNVEQDVDVEETKPAVITVYDYYIAELKLDKSYSLPTNECKISPPHIEPLDDIVVDPIAKAAEPPMSEETTTSAAEDSTTENTTAPAVEDSTPELP